MTSQVDIVVRFHDPARIAELERCVFSLASQTYQPINIILVLQRFSAADIDTAKKTLLPLVNLNNGAKLSILNYDAPHPADARSALLNLGIDHAEGRYLGFLDYDDVVYPEAYRLLTDQLRQTKAAIAFASVRVMRIDVYDTFLFSGGKASPPFKGNSLADLFRANFCPLHSYLLDRERVSPDTLRFNTALTVEEDYDFLLRICAQHQSDFSLVGTSIGDYHYKTDGSNTVPTEGGLTGEALDQYLDVRAVMEETRKSTIVSEAVQRDLGFPASKRSLTIRDVVKNFNAGWWRRLTNPGLSPQPSNLERTQ